MKILILFILNILPVFALDINSQISLKHLDVFYISGEISTGDSLRMQALLESEKKPLMLILNSVGGMVDEMEGIIQSIQASKRSIYIGVDNICASACVPIFVSVPIKNRFMFSGSRLGFHSAQLILVGKWTIRNRRSTDQLIYYLKNHVSSKWIENNDSFFRSKDITWVYAQELIDENAGFISQNNLFPEITNNDYPAEKFIVDFIKSRK